MSSDAIVRIPQSDASKHAHLLSFLGFMAGDTSEVINLMAQLKSHREYLHPEMLAEVREAQKAAEAKAEEYRSRQLSKEEQKKLERLLSKTNSSFYGKPHCFPGTRTAVLQKLALWVQDYTSGSGHVFWLHGVSKCGKSAVATSISKQLDESRLLIGTFFCKRDEESGRDSSHIINALAFHLAKANSDFRKKLLVALDNEALAVNTDVTTRFEILLVQPLRSIQKTSPASTAPYVFVIDALDECREAEKIASNLLQVAQLARPWLKIIVTSRSLTAIRMIFKRAGALVEERDLFSEDDARNDIRVYLEEMIKREDLGFLQHYEDKFVEKAGGLFIWLHTVIELIKDTDVGRDVLVQEIVSGITSDDVTIHMERTYSTVLQYASGGGDLAKAKTKIVIRMIVGFLLVISETDPLALPISGLYAFIPSQLKTELKISLNEFTALIMKLRPVLRFAATDEHNSTIFEPADAQLLTLPPDRLFVRALELPRLSQKERISSSDHQRVLVRPRLAFTKHGDRLLRDHGIRLTIRRA